MDTTELNTNPTADTNDKSEKVEKAKKAAAKAAQFAGAAGLGVAGTMAANAMNKDDSDSIEESTTSVGMTEVTPEETPSEDLHTEPVVDFNPNDIMIDAEEVVIDEIKVEPIEVTAETDNNDVALVEPQPITGENVITTQANENLTAEIDPTEVPYIDVDIEPLMYGGPDGWEDTDPYDHVDIFDEDDTILADNDDTEEDFDIADDILA